LSHVYSDKSHTQIIKQFRCQKIFFMKIIKLNMT
jgi:hypothetical protein